MTDFRGRRANRPDTGCKPMLHWSPERRAISQGLSVGVSAQPVSFQSLFLASASNAFQAIDCGARIAYFGDRSLICWIPVKGEFSIRLAKVDDIQALEALIPLSVRVLQSPYYSSAQMEAALGPVFGVDRQLIDDGTYFTPK
jgi:hypothetical protein